MSLPFTKEEVAKKVTAIEEQARLLREKMAEINAEGDVSLDPIITATAKSKYTPLIYIGLSLFFFVAGFATSEFVS